MSENAREPIHQPCRCRMTCGDVDESHDPHGTCKALPCRPMAPLVEIVLVPKEARRDA